MLKISRTTLSDLEEELRTISFDYDNPIQMCDKSIESIVKHLRVLKCVLSIPKSKMKAFGYFKMGKGKENEWHTCRRTTKNN
jgi:hypothetical protein